MSDSQCQSVRVEVTPKSNLQSSKGGFHVVQLQYVLLGFFLLLVVVGFFVCIIVVLDYGNSVPSTASFTSAGSSGVFGLSNPDKNVQVMKSPLHSFSEATSVTSVSSAISSQPNSDVKSADTSLTSPQHSQPDADMHSVLIDWLSTQTPIHRIAALRRAVLSADIEDSNNSPRPFRPTNAEWNIRIPTSIISYLRSLTPAERIAAFRTAARRFRSTKGLNSRVVRSSDLGVVNQAPEGQQAVNQLGLERTGLQTHVMKHPVA